ncbi:MAG: alpha/beta fold hydrolase [Burkholderiales bacterium]|nr:alpha/beta fold hydrolase [Burkholderiales bacterium]
MINRLIFGRPRRRRDLPAGPHADFFLSPLRLDRPDGARLYGWNAAPKSVQDREKVLLYFGGRKEDAWWAPKMASYLEGWTVYSFNYRGFGDSKGSASEINAKADALAIYEFVLQRHARANTEVALMGRSLGTAIAIWLAHHVSPAHLILVSPFCSMRSVLRGRFWLAPLSVFVRKRFMNSKLVPDISARTLVILAARDKEVNHSDSLRLARSFGTQATITVIDGTNHKTVPRSPGTQRAVADFLTNKAAALCLQ